MAVKRFDIRGVDEMIKGISEIQKGGRKVLVQAVNRTATGAKTDAVALIRQHLMLKAGAIRDDLRIVKASQAHPNAVLVARSKRGLPLTKYPIRPSKVGGRKPKEGVSVQIKRHGGRKIIKGSFMARMKSGHVGVFKRSKGASRLPVRELSGVGFIGYLERGMIHRKLSRSISKRLHKNLDAGVRNLLRRNLERNARMRG